MKKILLILILCLSLIKAEAQLNKFSGGLAFASGLEFNTGNTGNPGFFGKAYFEIFDRTYLVPSFSAFMAGKDGSSLQSTSRKTYLLQADADIQYGVLREDKLRLYGFAGFNASSIISKADESTNLENNSKICPGLNLGAYLEMDINNAYDVMLSGKYIVGEFDQFIIQLGVVYHFSAKKRRGW